MSQTKAQLIDPVDGTIVNADINASAAIAGSKIDPDFGSQGITTTGVISMGNGLTLTGTNPFIDIIDSNNNSDFTVKNDNGTFEIQDKTNSGATRLAIDSSGNLGIGTTSMDDLVHISTAENASKGLRITNTNNSQASAIARVFISGGDNAKAALRLETNGQFHDIFERNTGELTIEDNGTERIRIDSSGNVGINQVPTRELSLHSPNNNNALIHFTNDDTGETSADGILVGLDGNENMVINNQETGKTINFSNGGSERLRIESDGSIAIKTNDVALRGSGTLRINSGSTSGVLNLDGGSSNHGGEINLFGGSNGGRIIFRAGQGAGQQSEKMRLTENGRLGIGTTSPSNAVVINTPGSAANCKLEISQSGGGGGTSEILFSDTVSGRGRIFFDHGASPEGIKFEAAGTQTLIVTTGGRVGIGTTDPNAQRFSGSPAGVLNVHGTKPVFYVSESDSQDGNGVDRASYIGMQNGNTFIGSTSAGGLIFQCGDGTASERMRINASGNVGIGETSPSHKLHISAAENSTIAYFDTDLGGRGLKINTFASGNAASAGVEFEAPAGAAKSAFVFKGASEFMRIDPDGDVLVGLTTALSTQTGSIQAAGPIIAKSYINAHTSNAAVLQYISNKAVLRAYGATSGSGVIQFNVGGGGDATDSEAMRIDSSGNVSVGGTSPSSQSAKFQTRGTSQDATRINMHHEGDSSASISASGGLVFGSDTSNGTTERLRIKSDGDIVKTVVNNETFRMDQTSAANNKFHNFMYSRSAGGRGDVSVIAIGEGSSSQGNIKIRTSAGNAAISGGVELINGNTAFSAISDIRLKNKISDITDALTNIDKIEPIKYSWKYDTDNTPHIGVSAQSVNEVYPEIIELTRSSTDESDETDYLSVLHTELIPVCIAAIKELKAKVEALEAA